MLQYKISEKYIYSTCISKRLCSVPQLHRSVKSIRTPPYNQDPCAMLCHHIVIVVRKLVSVTEDSNL